MVAGDPIPSPTGHVTLQDLALVLSAFVALLNVIVLGYMAWLTRKQAQAAVIQAKASAQQARTAEQLVKIAEMQAQSSLEQTRAMVEQLKGSQADRLAQQRIQLTLLANSTARLKDSLSDLFRILYSEQNYTFPSRPDVVPSDWDDALLIARSEDSLLYERMQKISAPLQELLRKLAHWGPQLRTTEAARKTSIDFQPELKFLITEAAEISTAAADLLAKN